MIRLLYAIILFSIVSCTSKKFQTKKEVDKNGFTYERVEGDNSKTRIYTLDNGLNIYLSVNQEEPRIFTQIGVKAGSTYDPKETTGLAHYLEHMLFKGTSKLGALDWDKEKVLLDNIRDLYEEHKLESDEVKKKLIYGKIDSVSQLAAKLVSPNEYDKLMQNIGGSNTNAYTSSERTVYINEIPSNEIERWLTIEKERFSELVLRLFHTELEAVYEEYNMRMKDSDYSKSYKKLFELLYLKHPLGTQTTIGEADHLKNPSWLNIEDYFIKYYVPNNMCIAMSGDFDMDNTIKLINEHFGSFAMKDVPDLVLPKEEPINNVRTAEVLGPDEEFISIGFRLGNNESGDEKYGELLSKVLYNGTAGLIDLNLIQKQKVLGAFTWYWQHKDYASHMFFGYAREGQKLDEVKELILGELNKIKEGDFDAALIESAITDFRKEQMKSNESNYRRCSGMVDAFIQGYDWSDVVSNIDDMSKITKEKLIEFVKKNYHDNNYAIVYKRFGEDTTGISIDKPKITPVPLNRGVESSISKEINAMKANKIEASFLDFNKDIEHLDFNDETPLKVVKNNINSRFSVTYTFEMGNDHSKDLGVAINVLPLLGTSKYSPEELKKKWYSMGVDMSVRTWGDRSFVSINGIKESMASAVDLLDHVLRDVKFDSLTYLNFVKDELKSRENNMKNKYYLFHGAVQMVKYGKLSSFNNEFSESELKALDLGVMTEKVQSLLDYPHEILYYGPHNKKEMLKNLSGHKGSDKRLSIGVKAEFPELDLKEPKVYFVDYDMEQTYLMGVSKVFTFNKDYMAFSRMYNEFFGSGLSSIVFQEIRESRALAYSARSKFSVPGEKEKSHYLNFSALTQSDKLQDVVDAFHDLLQNLPEAEDQFEGAKMNVLKGIESERITKTDIYWSYKKAHKRGFDHDLRKDIYEEIQTMTFEDFKNVFNEYVKPSNFQYVVVGDKAKVAPSVLNNLGEVKTLTREEVLNYY